MRVNGPLLALGVATVAVAAAPPLATAAEESLPAHMAQHVLLAALAPPLLALAVPLRLAPKAWDRWATAAVAASTVVLLAWHAPGLYEAALDSPLAHVAEHASFLGAGVALWAVVVAAPHAGREGLAAVALFVSVLPAIVLGALMTVAGRPWYPSYDDLGGQQLAGVVMWAYGGLSSLAGTCALFATWLRRPPNTA